MDIADALSTILSKEDIYAPTVVKSPAQIEKAFKKNDYIGVDFKEIINPLLAERKPGKPIMVAVTDKRPALPPTVDKMFDDPLT